MEEPPWGAAAAMRTARARSETLMKDCIVCGWLLRWVEGGGAGVDVVERERYRIGIWQVVTAAK